MQKNNLIVLFILNFIMLPSLSVFAIDNPSIIRPEVKNFIDGLYDAEISYRDHTTDSIEPISKKFPDEPKVFDAGRFKVIFNKAGNNKVLIFQTEEKVGHMAPVIPGKTEIGGWVEIQRNSQGDGVEGVSHTTKGGNLSNEDMVNPGQLNEAELDYLIQMLYKKFEKPVTDNQAINLNKVKDYALAIKFSGKSGISEYHYNLKNKLR